MAQKSESDALKEVEATPEPELAPAESLKPAATVGGLAIAALIVGIFSVVTAWLAIPGLLAGIAAIILAALALKRRQNKGFSVAGLVTGIVGTVGGAVAASFWVLALIVGIGTASVNHQAVKNAQDQLEAFNQQNQAKIDAKKDFAKGDTAVFDEYKVKVNSINDNYQAGDGFSNPADGKKYISVNMTVTNNSDQTVPVNTYLFGIIDNGVTQNASYVDGANPLQDGDLAKGASATGDVVYEVSSNASNLKLSYMTYGYDKGEYKELTYTLAL